MNINKIFLIAFISWAIAQILKIIIHFVKFKKWNLNLIFSAGGMPSSHTSFMIATTTAIGLKEGFQSSIFALSLIVSFVVMYDATGVRKEAGNQAKVLNQIMNLFENDKIDFDKKLKELLGHTPVEVFGGLILGILVGYFGYKYFY